MSDSPEPAALAVQLAVINSKLDTLILQRDDHESRLRGLEKNAEKPEQRADQETRLRKLEQFRWILMGAAIASGPIANAVTARL